MRSWSRYAFAAAFLVTTGCRPAPDRSASPATTLPPPSGKAFTDITEAAGIAFRHRLPDGELSNLVDADGAGALFSDLDGDGWLDLVLLGGPRSPHARKAEHSPAPIRLLMNTRDGRFRDATAGCGIAEDAAAIAAAAADVDGDGDRDLYLVDRGPNRLYLNSGGGKFVEAPGQARDPGFGIGAAFFDMDGDGDLDLYVSNYLSFDTADKPFYKPEGFPGPMRYDPEPDVLYRNRGDGTFDDVSKDSGIGLLRGRGMSVTAFDADGDFDTDIFVANDVTANFLFLNDGKGRFREAAFEAGVAMGDRNERTSAMAGDVGDVDGDGLQDLAVSDTAYGALYLQRGPAQFKDAAMMSGTAILSGQYVSWGQNLLDFDNDGDLDILTVNGGLHHLVGWEDLLMANDGKGGFRDAAAEGGPHFSAKLVGRGSITGDYDNDGDIDVLITTLEDSPRLLRNDSPSGNSWLTVDLSGAMNRDPYGAKVTVRLGKRAWDAEYRCRTNFLGQSDPRLHFGLGRSVKKVDSITVRWPDRTKTVIKDVETGRFIRIDQKEGRS